MNCGQAVPVPLGVCLTCGGGVLWSDMEGADYAVEAGPIASMNFRGRAIELLENHLEGFDPLQADKTLKSERVRVVEGLDKDTAENMRNALGVKQTTASVSRGATPKAGAAGALRGGLPFVGLVVGLALAPVIGWAVGIGLGAAGAVGLAVMNTRRPMPVLGRAPVGPYLETDINGLARRIFAAKGAMSEHAAEDLRVISDTAFEMVAAVTDPDDIVALGTGGIDGGLAGNAIKMANQGLLLAEGAVRAGRDDWNDEEKTSVERLKTAVTEAMRDMAQLSSGASGVDELEAMMAQEVELARETAEELDYLEV